MVSRSLGIWQVLSGISEPQQAGIVPQLVHDPFPPNSFQFIIHLPSHNWMLYSTSYINSILKLTTQEVLVKQYRRIDL